MNLFQGKSRNISTNSILTIKLRFNEKNSLNFEEKSLNIMLTTNSLSFDNKVVFREKKLKKMLTNSRNVRIKLFQEKSRKISTINSILRIKSRFKEKTR